MRPCLFLPSCDASALSLRTHLARLARPPQQPRPLARLAPSPPRPLAASPCRRLASAQPSLSAASPKACRPRPRAFGLEQDITIPEGLRARKGLWATRISTVESLASPLSHASLQPAPRFSPLDSPASAAAHPARLALRLSRRTHLPPSSTLSPPPSLLTCAATPSSCGHSSS